jgi:nondiscriminating glutamyl-tRNA synthetase
MSYKGKKEIQNVRVRIAPSPTGRFHIGTARTALFNYLFVKHYGGSFVLRVEDTDIARSDAEYEKDILAEMDWLGIVWDEGPDMNDTASYKGGYGPYRQSERLSIYRKYLERMLGEGLAYRCFCTEAELEAERNKAEAEGKAPRYSGKCRDISAEEAEKRAAGGEKSILRFKTPQNTKVPFRDLIRGEMIFDTENLDDFSIAKGMDMPLYNFAVVADDYEMKITHVIRGEDHLSNTPKQILLCNALGLPVPEFAHLPLILGSDRSKMSKRHGAVAVADYRAAGYLPEAMFNFAALLGWNPKDNTEIMPADEIIKRFDIYDVQKAGAIFNQEKLDWMNAAYIRNLSDDELELRIKPFWKADITSLAEGKARKIIGLCKDRMRKLTDINELAELFFVVPEYEKDILIWKDMKPENAVEALKVALETAQGLSETDYNEEELDRVLPKASERVSDKKGVFYWPLRVALSGKKASPPPGPIMAILGKEETCRRISAALKKLS